MVVKLSERDSKRRNGRSWSILPEYKTVVRKKNSAKSLISNKYKLIYINNTLTTHLERASLRLGKISAHNFYLLVLLKNLEETTLGLGQLTVQKELKYQ